MVQTKRFATDIWFEGFKIGVDLVVADQTELCASDKMTQHILNRDERKRNVGMRFGPAAERVTLHGGSQISRPFVFLIVFILDGITTFAALEIYIATSIWRVSNRPLSFRYERKEGKKREKKRKKGQIFKTLRAFMSAVGMSCTFVKHLGTIPAKSI